MKSLSLLLSLLLLSACSTVPVIIKWPDAPASLLEPPEKLQQLSKNHIELTDIIENASENAGKYYALREKYLGWQEWYNKNKQIYEEVRKKYSK
jgi:hypothetical protein